MNYCCCCEYNVEEVGQGEPDSQAPTPPFPSLGEGNEISSSQQQHCHSKCTFRNKFLYFGPNDIRGCHTFSILSSINGEVPCGSFVLGACVLRSSRSQPPTLKNLASGSFPNYFFILCLTKFTLVLLIPVAILFYCVFCVVIVVKECFSVEYMLVNSFFNFHSPCLPHQKGASHLLHVQGLPIGSLFLKPLSHS